MNSEDGKKIILVKRNCEVCKQEFKVLLEQPKMYCSIICKDQDTTGSKLKRVSMPIKSKKKQIASGFDTKDYH